MKMDLPGLQMLVAAIESKSLSKAADRENLATSAASKRITELERRLGAVLLVRHGRGVEPTPAGVALYHRAKAILRSVELAQHCVAEFGSGGMPKIRLAANRSSIIQFLPAALSRYFSSEPGAQIELQERYSYDIPRLVIDAEADLGIYHATTPAPGVHSVPWQQDRVVLVVPLDHPLARRDETTLEAANDYPFVGYFPRHSYEAFLSLAEAGLSRPLNVRIEVSNYEARCRMIREGIGIGIMPELIAASYLARYGLKAIRLLDDWAVRQFFLCTRGRGEVGPELAAFMAHLLAA
ncbi:LysR family transcriptional regulator [Burkholderia sp. WAC0059]|uniref:LysR family transcriptional regulator n=1 Tax=Burkholderia sp. WAC0059 TaxID=2066022 RepID=UPI002155457B|nr:LysR family transcriptional regulator [Burkholderia sp. WAC0059]